MPVGNLLLVIDSLGYGGAERSTLEIAKRCLAFRPSVMPLLKGGGLERQFRSAMIKVLDGGGALPRDLPAAVRRVSDAIREEQIDIVHSSLFWADLVARISCTGRRIPLVGSFVNDSYSSLRYLMERRPTRVKLAAYHLADRISARRVDRFVAISNTVKESNCRALGVPPEKVVVIPRGRDPDTYRKLDATRLAVVAQELRSGDTEAIILNVGRLLKRKGQLDLIRAMPHVLRSYPRCRAIIAGEGPFRRWLEHEIRELGLGESVRLLGTRDDVPYLLAAADIFVFPSHYEGHGGALVEAMFAGRPIVAADTPVHRESVQDGDSALLFTRGEPGDMARSLVRLLDDPELARQLGVMACRQASEKFHIETAAKRHERLYEELLEKGRHVY